MPYSKPRAKRDNDRITLGEEGANKEAARSRALKALLSSFKRSAIQGAPDVADALRQLIVSFGGSPDSKARGRSVAHTLSRDINLAIEV
jgi:hypothetical protein